MTTSLWIRHCGVDKELKFSDALHVGLFKLLWKNGKIIVSSTGRAFCANFIKFYLSNIEDDLQLVHINTSISERAEISDIYSSALGRYKLDIQKDIEDNLIRPHNIRWDRFGNFTKLTLDSISYDNLLRKVKLV